MKMIVKNIAVVILSMAISIPVNAQSFWKKLGQVVQNVAEAAVVVAADRAVEKYAPDQAAKYRETMEQLNRQEQQRVAEENAAWEQYKQGRIQELRSEQGKYYNSGAREAIQQEIDELNSIEPTYANTYNTSLTESSLYECGIKQQNIRRGMEWNDAQNKYEKQNIAKDYIFDAAGEFTGQTELLEKFRQISEAQNTYLSDRAKAMTEEEKQAALDKRNLAYFDIGYDTYQEAKSRKSQYLAEKLNIADKLIKSGKYEDTELACEIAANIISIQKSNLPEEEKAALIRSYGLNNDVEEIQQISSEVIAMDESVIIAQEEEKRLALLREKEEKERLERERQAKLLEERNNAIQKVSNLVVPVFVFDETNLTELQKAELNEVANVLEKYEDLNLTIVGHTCKIGYKNINMKKGLKRAESAKVYLMEKGVSESRISVDSKGELEPKSKINSENRRIEFTIK